MKKKILNVLLTAAVVTTMMFSATACGSKTVSAETWVSSDTAETYVKTLDTMFGGQMTASFEADGETLVMVVTLSKDMLDMTGDDLTDEMKTAMQEAMQQQYDSTSDEFATIRDELRKELKNDSLAVRIVYELSDGTELFSQDL